MSENYPFIWDRKHLPTGRKGHLCRISDRGKVPETCVVQFKSDGRQFVVVRAGLKKVTDLETQEGEGRYG